MKNTWKLIHGVIMSLIIFITVQIESFGQCSASDCPNGTLTITASNFNTYSDITVNSGETKCLVFTGSYTLGGGVIRINGGGTLNICTTDPSYIATIPSAKIDLWPTGGKDWTNGGAAYINVNCKLNCNTQSWGDDLVLTISSTGVYNNTFTGSATSAFNGSRFINYGTYNYLSYHASNILNFGGGSLLDNYGTINSNRNISFADDVNNHSTGVINANLNLDLNSGANLINNGLINIDLDFNSNAGSFFDNNKDFIVYRDTDFSGSYSQNSSFKNFGTMELNAAGTMNISNGIFETDSLILYGGTLNASTSCAVFLVNKYSSIQNGSGLSAIPAGNVGILDLGNPGQIDNVACQCGGVTDNDQLDNAITAPTGTQCTVAAAPNTGTYCGIKAISSLSSAGGCYLALPVKWLDFSAKQITNNVNQIKWSVSDTRQLLYFEVEYSIDGINFEPIVRKYNYNAEGNLEFDYKHYVINNNIYYYRIKEVSINEQIDYTRVISVSQTSDENLFVYPNPSDKKISIIANSLIESIEIYDLNGKLLNTYMDGNYNDISIESLNQGTYYIKANMPEGFTGTMFMKK